MGSPRIVFALIMSVATVPMASACIELSPFEADLSASERDQNRKNIERIAALPPPGQNFRFAVIADHHQAFAELEQVVDRLNEYGDLAFVVHLGDMTRLGLRHDFRLTLLRLQQLDVPFVTTIGNHDAISNGKAVYREMFGPYDYSFDFGSIRFVCFNSNALEFSPDPPDLGWLAAASAPAPGINGVVALAHVPSPEPGYIDVLLENGVLALITAHDHRFDVSQRENLLLVSVDDAWSRRWSIVTIEGSAIRVDNCSLSGCRAAAP